MKKLLAIVLALVMLTASAALAETATVATFSDAKISVTDAGEAQQISLDGLTFTVAAGMAGEAPADEYAEDTRIPTAQIEAVHDGEILASGVMQVIDDRMILSLDGMSAPLALDMSAAGGMAGQGYKTLFAKLPQLATMKLPTFKGVEIPKLELMSVASLLPMLGITAEVTDTSATFEVPAEVVNSLVQALMSQIPESAMAAAGDIVGMVNQVLESGGFALKGSIADNGDAATLTIDVLIGATGDALFELVFTTAQNQDNLDVVVFNAGEAMTLGSLALTSLPADAELDFSMNVLGAISLTASLYPGEGGTQVAALELKGVDESQNITASLEYGESNGIEFTDANLAVPNVGGFSGHVERTDEGNGKQTGMVGLEMSDARGIEILASANFTETIEEGFTFRNVENVADAIDVNSLTDEQSAQLTEEFNAAMGKLMGYLGSLQPAA